MENIEKSKATAFVGSRNPEMVKTLAGYLNAAFDLDDNRVTGLDVEAATGTPELDVEDPGEVAAQKLFDLIAFLQTDFNQRQEIEGPWIVSKDLPLVRVFTPLYELMNAERSLLEQAQKEFFENVVATTSDVNYFHNGNPRHRSDNKVEDNRMGAIPVKPLSVIPLGFQFYPPSGEWTEPKIVPLVKKPELNSPSSVTKAKKTIAEVMLGRPWYLTQVEAEERAQEYTGYLDRVDNLVDKVAKEYSQQNESEWRVSFSLYANGQFRISEAVVIEANYGSLSEETVRQYVNEKSNTGLHLIELLGEMGVELTISNKSNPEEKFEISSADAFTMIVQKAPINLEMFGELLIGEAEEVESSSSEPAYGKVVFDLGKYFQPVSQVRTHVA